MNHMENGKLTGNWDYIGVILGLYGDNGKENGNYHNWLSRIYK